MGLKNSSLSTTASTGCTHPLLMRSPEARVLRCRPVRETPIYEQLRGERINADVPPSEAASPPVGRSGRHRRLAETTVPSAVCAPPGPGADLAAHQHPVPGIADQPPGATRRPAAGREARAALPRPAHAGQTPAHAASSPPTSRGAYAPAAVASEDGAFRETMVEPRPTHRTDCSAAAMPRGQFSWFEADYDERMSCPDKKGGQNARHLGKGEQSPRVLSVDSEKERLGELQTAAGIDFW
jgi:hypothetical protein